MKFNRLSVKDKELFNKYLTIKKHSLSNYAFQNIYIWKNLFDIYWVITENSLCLFFKDKAGVFMYLPPLVKNQSQSLTEKIFNIMHESNKNQRISRIENVEKVDAIFFTKIGYAVKEKTIEYICNRSDLAKLKGNKYKSKRACVNYFKKNNKFTYTAYLAKYKQECIHLYEKWSMSRKNKNSDTLYCHMMDDNYSAFKILINEYDSLDMEGRLIFINNELKGATFGYKLNEDTFCILYEIADLDHKGISQYIFQKFSNDLAPYKFINIMDDSSLLSLRKVKLSYCPSSLQSSYIVRQ